MDLVTCGLALAKSCVPPELPASAIELGVLIFLSMLFYHGVCIVSMSKHKLFGGEIRENEEKMSLKANSKARKSPLLRQDDLKCI